MSKKKLFIILGVFFLMALCATACGADSSESPTPVAQEEVTAQDDPSGADATAMHEEVTAQDDPSGADATEASVEGNAGSASSADSGDVATQDDSAASLHSTPPLSGEASVEGNAGGSSSVSTMEIDPKTGKDRYQTDPVPEGKPTPVEPQDAVVTDKAYTCTLSVECSTILDNLEKLDKEKIELVPEDGIIFPATAVTFYEGESVFNVLQREMKKARIHMEFMNTPIYNSAYIEGINNLYEFDCGELSGWMYSVNGWFPNYGCSRYQLKDGDIVEWRYTCDLGHDVGDNSLSKR